MMNLESTGYTKTTVMAENYIRTAIVNQKSWDYLKDAKHTLDNEANALKEKTALGLERSNIWDFLNAMDAMATQIKSIREIMVDIMQIKEER